MPTMVLAPPLGDLESLTRQIATEILADRFADVLLAVDTAINLTDDDGALLTTPRPAVAYAYERATLEAYPAVEVIGVQTVYDASADEATGTHRISIDVTQVGDSEATVTRDVQRLVLAVRKFFRRRVIGDGLLGTAAALVESEDYTQLAPHPTAPFMKGGLVVLSVQTWSD